MKKYLFLFFVLFYLGVFSALADKSPAGCMGSGLNIALYTNTHKARIGDTISYSVMVFNGVFPTCDATSIRAVITTPDGAAHPLSLFRTTLIPGQSDYYDSVVSYVARSVDVLSSGTISASASVQGIIHQNTTNSLGGGSQSVNAVISRPCISLSLLCTGSIMSKGLISYKGTVANCGNNNLINVEVTNHVDGGEFIVPTQATLLVGESATFTSYWQPVNSCGSTIALMAAKGTEQNMPSPLTVSSVAESGAACIPCGSSPFVGAVADCCGVCGGDGTSCVDCTNTTNGSASIDACGVCNGDGSVCAAACIDKRVTPSAIARVTSKKVLSAAKVLAERVRLFAQRAAVCGTKRFSAQTAQANVLLKKITTIVTSSALQVKVTQCANALCTHVSSIETKLSLRKLAKVLYETQLSTKRGALQACRVVHNGKRDPTVKATKYYYDQLTKAINKLSVEKLVCR
jgi:hypothetical protein